MKKLLIIFISITFCFASTTSQAKYNRPRHTRHQSVLPHHVSNNSAYSYADNRDYAAEIIGRVLVKFLVAALTKK